MYVPEVQMSKRSEAELLIRDTVHLEFGAYVIQCPSRYQIAFVQSYDNTAWLWAITTVIMRRTFDSNVPTKCAYFDKRLLFYRFLHHMHKFLSRVSMR